MTKAESRHIERIKNMDCALCGASGPCDAHHILEGRVKGLKSGDFTAIPLCKDCHQGSHNGIHGRRAMWSVMRKTELQVLGETIERLIG